MERGWLWNLQIISESPARTQTATPIPSLPGRDQTTGGFQLSESAPGLSMGGGVDRVAEPPSHPSLCPGYPGRGCAPTRPAGPPRDPRSPRACPY